MLITLLMLQALLTQVLNQSHQAVLSQMQNNYQPIPALSPERRLAALAHHASIQLVAQTPERQFYSAQISLCEAEECLEFVQFFSVGSAILKGDIRFHSVRSL